MDAKYRRSFVVVAALCSLALVVGSVGASSKTSRSHSNHGQAPLSAKDKEIAGLKAQVAQLQADLVRAQAKIDSLETPSVVPTPQPSPVPTPSVKISDLTAQRFASGDAQGDPMWVFVFQFENDEKSEVALPSMAVSCTDNYSGDAAPYRGNKGTIVVDPENIEQGDKLHLKYSWVALSPAEVPRTVTITVDGSSFTIPVTIKSGG